ncbi:hypothetical protein SH661x_001740 [Planctomicrobium sp. SH661]|uniref:hypothetical protein n=1 Tax=Planctomicrobium sp. SH661 TaxID=3448124 RepID=UPI003F5ADF61
MKTFVTTSQLILAHLKFTAVILAICHAGCQREGGVRRFTVSGTITLDGQPVPAGEILFEPDTEKGGSGPAGIAEIKQGKFRTRKQFGISGGPQVATITANTGEELSTDGITSQSYMLLSKHRIPIDFSDGPLQRSIEISSADLKRK